MSVNLLFKIAAVGILVSVLGQVLKHSDQNCSSWDYRDFTGVVSQRDQTCVCRVDQHGFLYAYFFLCSGKTEVFIRKPAAAPKLHKHKGCLCEDSVQNHRYHI